MNYTSLHTELREAEAKLLAKLRNESQQRRNKTEALDGTEALRPLTMGQKVADSVAATMGSWRFILIQSFFLLIWVILNVTAYVRNWDPYPFILLNLALSFQAAYAAPFIMMSQNRQQDIDRLQAKNDYEVNIKAALEIELLHQKIDQLRETEVVNLTQSVKELAQALGTIQGMLSTRA